MPSLIPICEIERASGGMAGTAWSQPGAVTKITPIYTHSRSVRLRFLAFRAVNGTLNHRTLYSE